MATKKNAPKTSIKAPKAKAAKKAPATVAPAEVVTTPVGECPRGGDHEWTEESGSRFCLKCLEPADATTKAKGKRVKANPTQAETTAAPESKPQAKGRQPKAMSKASAETTNKKLSAIDAAAKVLAESSEPLNTKQMIEAMAAKGYWSSPGGKTPHATLYSAILREITAKGNEARFKKTERGHFTING